MTAPNRQEGKRHRFADFFSHLIIMLIIFILPELMMNIANPGRSAMNFFPGFYLKTLVYIAAFYINYFFVIDRTLVTQARNRHIIRFVLWNILIIIAGTALCWLASRIHWRPRHTRWEDLPWWNYMLKSASFILRDTIMMILTIALAVALKLSSKWRNLQQRHREMLAAQRTTELDNLKSQVNPHFLFNTLNTIYALIAVDPGKAQNAIHRLSGLLRYTLYENERTTELKREADFITNYVELMRMRMQSRKVNVTVELNGHENTQVPPLLCNPLIENAFKYGHSAPIDRSIDISIIVSDSRIVCSTENRFITSDTSLEETKSSGIGLANLRRRLSLLYGNNASLRTTVNGDCYTAILCIPLTTPPNQLKQ